MTEAGSIELYRGFRLNLIGANRDDGTYTISATLTISLEHVPMDFFNESFTAPTRKEAFAAMATWAEERTGAR